MKRYLLIAIAVIPLFVLSSFGQQSAFTYQGRLSEASGPSEGLFDVAFMVWDSATGGTVVGNSTNFQVQVSGGVFTTTVDCGQVFSGASLWVEIAVRRSDAGGSFYTLQPRQAVTPTPYAIHAASVDGINPTNIQSQFAGKADVTWPTFVGDVTITTNAAHPHGWLYMEDGQSISMAGNRGSMFFNAAHPGGGEYQINSMGSMSLNVGLGNSYATLQIGTTGHGHEAINFQYDEAVSPSLPLGHSKNVSWISTYWNGTGWGFGQVGMRSEAMDTNGNVILRGWNPSYLNPQTGQPGGIEQFAMLTNGFRIDGKLVRTGKASAPGQTFVIDFEASTFIDVLTPSLSSLAFQTTNVNAAVERRLYVRSGASPIALSFPPGWIWQYETSGVLQPASLDAQSLMTINLTAIGAGDTNIIATYKFAALPQ